MPDPHYKAGDWIHAPDEDYSLLVTPDIAEAANLARQEALREVDEACRSLLEIHAEFLVQDHECGRTALHVPDEPHSERIGGTFTTALLPKGK